MPSLTERVFERLRASIVSGELAPNQPIVIEQLATTLQVSRTPIREALPALLQVGLLEEDSGGFRVAPLDATYVWQVYAVRSALESLAAEVVAPELSDEELEQLRAIVGSASPKAGGDYSEVIGPDLEFHDYIRARCPLSFLNALIDSVQVHRSRLLKLEHSADSAYRKRSYEEHRAILAALEARDGARTRKLMQEHLDRIGNEIAALAKRETAAAV